jgi:hypothetical protein
MDPLLKHSLSRDHSRIDDAACPDPETLAAFADGELSSEEAAGVTAHAADCQRCSDVLALVAVTGETPPASASAATPPAPVRWKHHYWTVPLATAATVAGLWVLIPREAVAPTETRLTSGDSAASARDARQKAEQEAAPPLQDARQRDAAAPQAANPAAAPTRPSELAPPERQLSTSQDLAEAPAAPGAAAAARERGALARRSAGRAPATAASSAAPEPGASQIPPNAQPPESVARVQVRREISMAVEGSAARWRAIGRTVERSVNGGATWMEEFTAPQLLTAGAAVSPDVAWLAGERGLVVRRTPAGWMVVSRPAAETITAIRASGATAATVTLASGRMLETSDAGVTWR